ncbi:MAG: NAD(P)/FAD-dependent oxidoreductase [Bacteroidales bacterium]|nr:NAD(P)/FAD-dependent oxidoreductase [Bacteroidales bacterium]MCF8334767.1 NAD(P)/FAD-dependent oxidoreductase [Bacteroidales bacterium]
MQQIANIPNPDNKRMVIVGGGFAGLKLARQCARHNIQIVLIDRNNYHQFQPLFYQVATAGLEPSSISFPLRKIFHKKNDVHFRMAKMEEVDPQKQMVYTNLGYLEYDYLVIATGVSTNYFGLENVKKNAIPMKSVSEAIYLRNRILENYEKALNVTDEEAQQALMNIVIVGGGPTGVELAGALAEMRKYILPKDYPELDFSKMQVYLFEAGDRLLQGMLEKSSEEAFESLSKLGVQVYLNRPVEDYDGEEIITKQGENFHAKTLIWTAGVTGRSIKGLPDSVLTRNNRIHVDQYNRIKGYKNIFAIGDIAYMETPQYPNGHPQVAQVAIQQAQHLSKNLVRYERGQDMKLFFYEDRGTMATIGRNRAVADLPLIHLRGFAAWILWLFVHLMAIVGVKNRFFIFINWMWNYITYDQSLRVLIRPKMFRYNKAGE